MAVSGLLTQLTSTLDADLQSSLEECRQVVEANTTWLAETIETNTRNLQFQTCAAP